MSNDGSEAKTHDPTPRRLDDARALGQVPASPELASALSLLAALLAVVALAPWAAAQVAGFQALVDRTLEHLSVAAVQAAIVQALALVAKGSAIPLAVASVVHLVVLRLQVGAVFSLDPVMPKLERLNPVDGFQRAFSLRSFVRLAILVVKAVIVAFACFLVCRSVLGDAVRVTYADAGAALAVARHALTGLLLWGGGLFVGVALLDFIYQRWQFLQDLRMTDSELKRERRDTHGDLKMRSQRQAFAHQLSQREQLDLLGSASLALRDEAGRVIVLLYRPRQFAWPVCMVRASGDFGAGVLQRLQQLRKPVVLDAPLVDTLFAAAQPGAPIPETWLPDVLAHLRSADPDRPNP